MKKPEKNEGKLVTLLIIVNGSPVHVTVNENAPLKTAVVKALEESGNTGRPIEDWQLKFNDEVLDLSKKIKEFDFTQDSELFLSLLAGVGGNRN